jgi:hypothetical protein
MMKRAGNNRLRLLFFDILGPTGIDRTVQA